MSATKPENLKAADRILATAQELFYREGARAIGVDEIVQRAGATKPSLYRAFGSKDQLIAAYLEGERARSLAYFDEAAAEHPEDPRAQLLAYFNALGRRATRNGYRGCGLSNAAVEYPDPAHPAHKAAVAYKSEMRERLRAAARRLEARKPKRLADALLLLIEGVYVTGQIFGADGPAKAVRGAAAALIDAHVRAQGLEHESL